MTEGQERLYNVVVEHAEKLDEQYQVKTYAIIAGIYKGLQMCEDLLDNQAKEIEQLKNEKLYLQAIIQEMDGEIEERS